MICWLQVNGFNVTGIQFEPGQLGPRQITVHFRDLTDCVTMELVAGTPATLSVLNWDATRVR